MLSFWALLPLDFLLLVFLTTIVCLGVGSAVGYLALVVLVKTMVRSCVACVAMGALESWQI